MIVDFHSHIAYHALYPSQFVHSLLDPDGSIRASRDGGGASLMRMVSSLLNDARCDRFVARMDEAGIDLACLLLIPFLGQDPSIGLSVLESVSERHPGRFLCFVGVDPRTDAGMNLFSNGERVAIGGVKMYPPLGYTVDDPRLEPCFDFCESRGIPIVVHTGHSFRGSRYEPDEMDRVEAVSERHPALNMVLAHAGCQLEAEAVRLASSRPGIYLDTAGFQKLHREVSDAAVDAMGAIFSDALHTKVVFGTDWPLFHIMRSPAEDVEFVRQLFRASEWSAEQTRLENVLGGNACRILGLDMTAPLRRGDG